ncbi:Pheromone a factor receptor [Nakaseomyces bracarensis]|uniref:Pheromone a factor receptor n=1 Tax=Nakaseomyces bracarensis TaxID=273131 RepID=A0ABR4NNS1_9SACH
MGLESTIIVLCSLGVLALIPPLAWHTTTRNIPAVILISWLLIMDIKYIVDAAIWSGYDFMQKWEGKGWCDIMVKLQIGANVGISCAVTNIMFNLHIVLKADNVLLEVGSWKKILRDLAISLLTPVLVMGLSHVVQISRYGILRYYGCTALFSPTWVSTVIYTMWLLIWSSIGAIYAVLVLSIYHRKRKDVKDILYCTNSGLNIARFARLLIFSFLIILVIFPFSIYLFVKDLKSLGGSFDFKATHSKEFWYVIIKHESAKKFVDVWLYVLMSYIVFLIFGLGSDALKMYANFLRLLHLGLLVEKSHEIPQNKFDKFLDDLLQDQERNTGLYIINTADKEHCTYNYHYNSMNDFPLQENEVEIEKSYVFKPSYRAEFTEQAFDDDDLTFNGNVDSQSQRKYSKIYAISTRSSMPSIIKDNNDDSNSPATKVDFL